MNYARTTSGTYYQENVDPIWQQNNLITKDEQMKRLGMVKAFNKDDKYQVILADGSIYKTPTSHRSRFVFDTAEDIIRELRDKGIKSELVRITHN